MRKGKTDELYFQNEDDELLWQLPTKFVFVVENPLEYRYELKNAKTHSILFKKHYFYMENLTKFSDNAKWLAGNAQK